MRRVTALLAVAFYAGACPAASASPQLAFDVGCLVSHGQGEAGVTVDEPQYPLHATGFAPSTTFRLIYRQSDDMQAGVNGLEFTTSASGSYDTALPAMEDVASKSATLHVEVRAQGSSAVLAALDVPVVPRQLFAYAPYNRRFDIRRPLRYRFEGFPNAPIYAHLSTAPAGASGGFRYVRSVLLGHGAGACGTLKVRSSKLSRIVGTRRRNWLIQFDDRHDYSRHAPNRLFDCLEVVGKIAYDDSACNIAGH